MVDLSTTYLGLKLKNPLVASASPLSKKVDNVKRLEDSGVSAVVMYSLFEEQIVHESMELDYHLEHGTESFPEALTYFPDLDYYNLAPQALSGTSTQTETECQHSSDRQSERGFNGRLGALRETHRRSWSGCT